MVTSYHGTAAALGRPVTSKSNPLYNTFVTLMTIIYFS